MSSRGNKVNGEARAAYNHQDIGVACIKRSIKDALNLIKVDEWILKKN